ncbi:MAG: hypothetical protein ACRD3P_13265 [Terriglobales bacterium]
MPVQFGIMCDRCRMVHLVSPNAKSSRIQYDRMRGEFKLVCIPPCTTIMYFSRSMLVSYLVPEDALARGYIEIDRCKPITKTR